MPSDSIFSIAVRIRVCVRRLLWPVERFGSHDLQSAYYYGVHLERAIGWAEGKGSCESDEPAGLVVGCKKVKEFVPKVRLARFQRESLPSRLGFPKGGEIEADVSSNGEA